jgi:hypothetical protein
VILQVKQMLCPLLHSMMGGAMYSMQTGHSSSRKSRRWRSSAMSSFISACELANTQVWNLLTNISQFVMSFIFLHRETAVKYKVVQLSLFGTHICRCLRITGGNPLSPHDLQNYFRFSCAVKIEGLTHEFRIHYSVDIGESIRPIINKMPFNSLQVHRRWGSIFCRSNKPFPSIG